MPNLITAGELAKLASTTKRTIQFYDQKGVLKPTRINSKNYRFYEEKQVLNYQMILLLSALQISLKEIKSFLKKGNLTDLFNSKKVLIKNQIDQLQFNLNSLEKFQNNLSKNGTMVKPQIKVLKPFGVYYIEKECAYAKIGVYCQELVSMFRNKKLTTLAIFSNPTYQPKKSEIKIAVLANKNIKIKEQFKNTVKYLKFSPGKVITYTHNGSGSLLSLFWKELEKYCHLNNLKVNKKVSDFEIYRKVNSDPAKQFFEIYLPIK